MIGRNRRGAASAWALVILAVAGLVLTEAQRVGAALFLIFRPRAAAPGTLVAAHTGGRGAFATTPVGGLPLFLVSEKVADEIPERVGDLRRLRDDARLVRVGLLRIDRHGDGRMSFTVPDRPPGLYVALLYCPPCAPFSSGRDVAAVGEFRITGSAGRATPVGRILIALAALGVLLMAAALVAKRKSRTGV